MRSKPSISKFLGAKLWHNNRDTSHCVRNALRAYLSPSEFVIACNAQVNVTLKFGSSNIAWAISPEDIIVQQVGDTCIGGFFAIDTSGTSAPPWIVGDVFLKNVYSVFRANPAAVGFATLSSEANGLSALGNPPSPTVGVAATVSGGSGTIRSSNSNDATNLAFGTMMSWLFLLFTSVISGCLIL